MLNLLEVICEHYLFNEERCSLLAQNLYAQLLPYVEDYNYRRIRILSQGRRSRGGGNVLYLMRVVNDLPVTIFPESDEQLLQDISSGQVDVIAFVDDFFGTGSTAIRELSCRIQGLKCRADIAQIKFAACALVGFDEATQKIKQQLSKEHPSFDVVVAKRLHESDRIFRFDADRRPLPGCQLQEGDYGSRFFASREDAQRVYNACLSHSLYFVDGRERPLGYGNLASPVVFHYNTPNNAPAVLWYKEKLWVSVFPRKSIREYGIWDPPRHPFSQLVRRQAEDISQTINNADTGVTLTIMGAPGSGKFLLASEVATRVRAHRNVFWFEFTEHSTADCLRNQLEQYLSQIMAGSDIAARLKRELDVSKKDQILMGCICRLSPLIVLLRLSSLSEKLPHVPAWERQKQALRVLLNDLLQWCKSSCDFLLTVDDEEDFYAVFDRSKVPLNARQPQLDYGEFFQSSGGYGKALIEACGPDGADAQRLSSSGRCLLVLLRTRGLLRPGLATEFTDEYVVSALYDSLSPLQKQVLLCAAAIRSHRTEGILREIHGVVWPSQDLKANDLTECVDALVKDWTPLMFRDSESGELMMSDSLRSSLFGKFIARSPETHLWHRAVADTYAKLEAVDWAKRMENAAVAVDHYIASNDEACLAEGCKYLKRIRDLFDQHGKLQYYCHLVSSLFEATAEYMDQRRSSDQIELVHLTLAFELLRAWRRLGEYEQMQDLCNQLLRREDWWHKYKVQKVQLMKFVAVLHGYRGERGDAITNLGSVLSLIADRRSHPTTGEAQYSLCGNELQVRLYMAQSYLAVSDHVTAVEHLQAAFHSLTDDHADKHRVANLHSLAVIARHLGTMFYLDGQAVSSLKWTNVSYALNTELRDVEGQAIALIKASLAWSTLREMEKATTCVDEAERCLIAGLPEQTYWLLAAYKARCQIRFRALRRRYRVAADFCTRDIDRELGQTKDDLNNLKERLERYKEPWLDPWRLELCLLQTEGLIWEKKFEDAWQEWTKGWELAQKLGGANHKSGLFGSLALLLRLQRTPVRWTVCKEDSGKWYTQAIGSLIRAANALTLSRLLAAQNWYCRQILDIVGDASVPSDDFVQIARLWASYRLTLIDRFRDHRAPNMLDVSEAKRERSPCSLFTAVQELTKLSEFPEGSALTKDHIEGYVELIQKRGQLCVALEDLLNHRSG
jgi:hypothetical protein